MSQLDKEVVDTEDPERFIDLINTMSFSAGNFNGKIPVQRVRTIFVEWLKRRDERKKREILNELNKDLFYYSTQPSGQFIKNTIMEKLGERIAVPSQYWPCKKSAGKLNAHCNDPDCKPPSMCHCDSCVNARMEEPYKNATPKRPAPNPPNKLP